MPVRTHRGRSSAYRALWQWPLHSPARLIACIAGLVLALVLVGLGLSALAGPAAGRPGADGTSAATTQPGSGGSAGASGTANPTALPPVAELTPSVLPPEQTPPRAVEVATQWATAWATHPAGTTVEAWLAGLGPYTTDEYLAVLAGVDPANVPATRVTGPATVVRYSPRSVQVDVPTDALTLRILVIDGESGWKVAGHDRAGQ